jgi:predicted Zn finger-like uncharacterized protein
VPILIVCPDCDARIRAPATAVGRQVRCPKCGGAFTAAGEDGAEAAPAPPAPEPEEVPAPPPPPAPTLRATDTPPEATAAERDGWKDATDLADEEVPEEERANVLLDFLVFRRMVAPVVVQVLFWVGLAAALLAGGLQFAIALSALYQGAQFGVAARPLLAALACWFVAPVLIRVGCEVLIAFFRVYDLLGEIREELRRQRECSSGREE